MPPAGAGSLVALELRSPAGTFDWSDPLLLFQTHAGSGLGPDPQLADLHIDTTLPGWVGVSLGVGGPLGSSLLPPGGVAVGFQVPPALVGTTLRVQAVALSPVATNGLYAATDATDLWIQ